MWWKNSRGLVKHVFLQRKPCWLLPWRSFVPGVQLFGLRWWTPRFNHKWDWADGSVISWDVFPFLIVDEGNIRYFMLSRTTPSSSAFVEHKKMGGNFFQDVFDNLRKETIGIWGFISHESFAFGCNFGGCALYVEALGFHWRCSGIASSTPNRSSYSAFFVALCSTDQPVELSTRVIMTVLQQFLSLLALP